MGKNNRHQKNLKSERAKVKLKGKKQLKNLPKGLNVTDTNFKVKKIIIREQLKHHEGTEILSRRKLNIKDLLTRLQHHNSGARQDAIREMEEMLSHHSPEILSSQLHSLLQGIASLMLDKQKDIRRDALKVLNSILGPISNEQLHPFADVLVSYLRCAMTHINPIVKEDSLLFLDVLAQNCGSLLARNARKVLPNFLDMISNLGSASQPGRQLVTTMSSRNTSVKLRTKVLSRLSTILSSMIGERRTQGLEVNRSRNNKILVVDPQLRHASIYNSNLSGLCSVDFDIAENPNVESELAELMRYMQALMPLMFDSWLEVSPKRNTLTSDSDPFISEEAANLLKSIADVIRVMIEYFELLETEIDSRDHSTWLRENFLGSLERNLMDKFPYSRNENAPKPCKRQEYFERLECSDKCDEQNFSLAYAHLWILTANRSNKIENLVSKNICSAILDHVNDRLRSWSNNDAIALPHLMKLLRVMLLRGSKVLYNSGFNLGDSLRAVIDAHARGSRRELQTHLFTILTEIVHDHELRELHSEKAFKDFVTSLPDSLLKSSINWGTIQILNRVVLQHGHWIRDKLANKHKEIIENAKNIEIIGSNDEQRSRLMICNLLYFIHEEIYY